MKTEGLEMLLTATSGAAYREPGHPVQQALLKFSLKQPDEEIGAFLIEQMKLTPPGIGNPLSVANILSAATDVHPWIYSWLHSVQRYETFPDSLPAIVESFPVGQDLSGLQRRLSLHQLRWFRSQPLNGRSRKAREFQDLLEQTEKALEENDHLKLRALSSTFIEVYRTSEDDELWAMSSSLAYIESKDSYCAPGRRSLEDLEGGDQFGREHLEMFVSGLQDSVGAVT